MKKIIMIEGMHCDHCRLRVEQALNRLDGVRSARVNLKKQKAVVALSDKSSDNDLLKRTIEDTGYRVLSIEEKGGVFQ
jgi:copper ion binding protein